MKQLTRAQAQEIYRSELWTEWSLEYIAKFQLYQNRLCLPFGKFHEAIEHELGRSVWTHEFASSNIGNLQDEYEGKKTKPTFEEIVELIPEEKRIVLLT